MRKLLRLNLEQSKKYDIEEAANGIEAERKIKEFLPDLIVLDIKMPGKGRYEVCLNLKEDPSMRNIKIIGITGVSGTIGESIMKALGADYFFEKPFDPKRLEEKIEELLG